MTDQPPDDWEKLGAEIEELKTAIFNELGPVLTPVIKFILFIMRKLGV